MINKLLCLIGFHKWEHGECEAFRFFIKDVWSYKICKVCGNIIEGDN